MSAVIDDHPVLEVRALTAGYDGPPVIRDVSLSVQPGEVVVLLGPNGAGKSTTLLTVSGFLRPVRGSILFRGDDVCGWAPYRIASAGMVQVPEGRSLVPSLTVDQNFRLVKGPSVDPYSFFPELQVLRDRRAGVLSGGEQQMLAIARALSMRPSLLLVDELSLGLSPLMANRISGRLRQEADNTGLSVLMVEQHVIQALAVADKAYVLLHGRVVLVRAAQDLRADPSVLEASYMGEFSDPLKDGELHAP